MSSTKIIDITNTLNFVYDYNINNLTSGSNLVTIDSYGVLTLNSTQDSSNSSTGSIVIPNGSVAINGNVNATDIANGGTLTVGGGGAFSQDVYIGGNLNITGTIISNASVQGSNSFNYLSLTSTDNSINLSTGSLVTNGGISIKAAGNATSSTSGGGITIAGGAGILRDLYVGGTANLPNVNSTNITASNVRFTNITSSTLNITGGITAANALITSSTITNLFVTNDLKATFNSNTIGSIFTTGGNVGINTTTPGYLLDINGNLRVNSNSLNIISASTLTDVLQIQNTSASGASTLQFLNNSGTSRASFGIGNASSTQFQNTAFLSTVSGVPIQLSAGGNTAFPVIINASDNSLSITSTTVSNSVSSGALKVSGGAGINGNLYVAGGLFVNSQLAATITNTTVSSNSTTGAVLLSGGLSINILSTSNANATSYTSGGALTINGGAAISQNVYISGIIDIASGSNNLNNISLQSFQFYSNSGSGTYSVIGSGNATRTATSFTPIRFTGWNDQTNPKLTINTNTIDIFNAVNAVFNSNTIGNIFTTGGNVGINTTQPGFNLDVNGTIRSTSITTGTLNSSNITTTNLVSTTATIPNIIHTNITTSGLKLTDNGFINLDALDDGRLALIKKAGFGPSIVSNNQANIIFQAANNTDASAVVTNTYTTTMTINSQGNVNIIGTLTAATSTIPNVVFTNSSLGTINSTGLTTGNINFTGNLFQNGVSYLGSQWTTTAANLSYTSGNVIVSGNVSSAGLISTFGSIGNLSSANISVSGNITVGGNLIVQGTLTSVNITTTNFVDTNITAGTLNATSATITNLTTTNSSLGTINSTGLTTGTLLATTSISTGTFSSTNTTTVNLVSTTSTIPNIIHTNISSGTLNLSTGLTTGTLLATTQISTGLLNSTNTTTINLVSTNSSLGTINSTGLTTGNINFTGNLFQNGVSYVGSQWTTTAGNLSYTSGNVIISGNVSSSGLISTFGSIGSLSSANITLSGNMTVGGNLLVLGTLVSVNITTTNFVDTNISAGTLNATNATIINLRTTNSSLGTINSTGLTTGNINFTGNLFQNGVSYLGSQWTTTASNLSYTSGGVVVTGLTTGNLNFTGNLFQNNIPYNASQWTTTAGSAISYTSGNVLIINANITNSSIATLNAGNLTTGNINFTGNLFQNGTPYIGSQWTTFNSNSIYFGTTGSSIVSIGTTNQSYALNVAGIISGTGLAIPGTTNSLNSTTGQYIFNSVSISSTAQNTSFTQGGALTVNGGVGVGGSIAVGGSVNYGGAASDLGGSFAALNNVSVATDITGLLFPSVNYRSFVLNISIQITATASLNAIYTISGIQTSSGWLISNSYDGDDTGIFFNIVSGTGQMQYTSTNQIGWILTNLVYKATVFSISANYIPTALSNSGNSIIAGSLSVNGSIISNNVDINASGTFTAVNGQTVPANITNLLLTSSIYSSFSIIMNVSLLRSVGGNLKAQYTIEGIQRDAGWFIYVTSLGDTIDLTFNILSTGQLQYSSGTTYTNFTSLTFYYNLKAFYTSGSAPLILPSGSASLSNLSATNISTGTLNTGTFIQGNSKKYIYTGTVANTTNGNMILSFNTLNSYLYAKVAVALQETSNLQNISVLQFECSAAGNTVSAVPNFWNLVISGTSTYPWFTGVTTGSSSTAATLQFAPITTLRNYNYTLAIDLVGTASAATLRQDNATVNTWAY